MDSTRLLAPGVPVSVAGVERPLRFSLLALKRLEDAFGSIADAEKRILEVVSKVENFDLTAKVMDDISLAAGAGLNLTPLQVLEGYDGLLNDLTAAVWSAWAQAWPIPTEQGGQGKAVAAGGTGDPSTTPQPSDGTAPTTSSGA